jgi:hypothetical protein
VHDAAVPSQSVQQTLTRQQLQPVVQSAPSTTGIGVVLGLIITGTLQNSLTDSVVVDVLRKGKK